MSDADDEGPETSAAVSSRREARRSRTVAQGGFLSRRSIKKASPGSAGADEAIVPPRRRLSVVGVLGEVLVTAGVVVMLFLGWYVWLGDVVAGAEQQQAAVEVQQELQDRWQRGEVEVDRAVDPGEPVITVQPPEGEVFGAIIVPRFGADWVRSVATGVDRKTILDSYTVGVGHYPDTQMPGEVGNFAVAGHRRTYGAAFGDIDQLRLGDKIYVETVDGWYEYSFRGLEYVWPTGVDVLAPVPAAPEGEPLDRILTMTSCNPRFSTAERIIAYAVFETWYPRAGGAPVEISELTEARQ